MACAVVAYVLVRNNPADAYALLPKLLVPETIRKSLHDSNFAVDPTFAPAMSAMIVTNNVKVAIIAFAGSVTLGALTVYIIAFNGLMLGGMGALFTNAGFGSDYWATIAPHGIIELTAIQIAGAAGLLIAAGALYPGRRRRRDLIVANAKRAGMLIIGVISMLIVAAIIEAFVSPHAPAGIGACSGWSRHCRSADSLFYECRPPPRRRRYNSPRRLTRRYSSMSAVVSFLAGTSMTMIPPRSSIALASRRSFAKPSATFAR